jgi:hypothetical protein
MAVEDFRPERLTRRQGLLGAAFTCLAPVVHAADAPPLLFDQLYKSFGVRGYEFSGVALALNGKQVAMRGYMAPPLKPESRFLCSRASRWRFAPSASRMQTGLSISW